MADLESAVVRARDALAEAADHNRVARLRDVAEALEALADVDGGFAAVDLEAALAVRLIADVDLVATGQLSRRFVTDSPLEAVLGGVLDAMAAEPDLQLRAALLEPLWRALHSDASETIATLPYGPGMVGGRRETYLPGQFRKLVPALWRAWRASRVVA